MKLYIQSENQYNRAYYGLYIKNTFVFIREKAYFGNGVDVYTIPVKKISQAHECKKSLKRIIIFTNNELVKIRDIKIEIFYKSKTNLSMSFVFDSCLARKQYIGDL